MIELDIKSGLMEQLNSFIQAYPIEIKDTGISYDPDVSTPFLEVSVLYGEPNQVTFGSIAQNRYNGILQIDINIPSGQGEGKLKEILRAIEPFFRRGISITHTTDLSEQVVIRVLKTYLSDNIYESKPNMYARILNIQWRCDLDN